MSFDIALLGMDGIGKSSVSDALAEVLRRQGFEVTLTSWRRHLRADRSGRGSEALHAAYGAMFRSIYSGCLGPDGESAEHLLDLDDLGFLADPDVDIALDVHHPAPFVAAGLMETAARLIERDFVIRPALAQGRIVIQESHGLKNVLKMGMFARAVTVGRVETDRALDEYFSLVHRCLAHWAPAAQSVVLRGDPRLACRWRERQQGRIPRGEHAGISGRATEASFIALQSGIQAKLIAIAEAERWPCVEMTDRAREENVAAAVRVTLDALAERDLIPREMAL
ncbi:hypothetical protein [Spirillospora sp. NPDC047279]|uniref:hypothetical protein n=1 Tax=Spirillospora sp. NPDC047279 TaxID=3155478 RepID=UPI00340A5EFE